MAATRDTTGPDRPRRPPAKTPQARENELIKAAVDLAEKQIRSGEASSQVITHFLKLATRQEALQQRKLEQEIKLLEAKSEQISQGNRIEELMTDALSAMREYKGERRSEEELDD